MNWILFVAFIPVPFLEVWILAELAETMPLYSILLVCLLAACYGYWLLRTEEFSLWTLLMSEIKNRRRPTEELLDALLILAAGLLLIMPGLLSDAAGFFLVVPQTREWAVAQLKAYIVRRYDL